MTINPALEDEIGGFIKASSKLLEVNESLENSVASLRQQVAYLQRELQFAKSASIGEAGRVDTGTVVEVLRDLQVRQALPENSDRTVAKLAAAVGNDPIKLIRIMKSAVAVVLPAPAFGPGSPLGYGYSGDSLDDVPSLEDYLEDPAPGREHEIPRRR